MSKHRLVEVSLSGICKEIANSPDAKELKDIYGEIERNDPGSEYGIVDENGYFIWSEDLSLKEQREVSLNRLCCGGVIHE